MNQPRREELEYIIRLAQQELIQLWLNDVGDYRDPEPAKDCIFKVDFENLNGRGDTPATTAINVVESDAVRALKAAGDHLGKHYRLLGVVLIARADI